MKRTLNSRNRHWAYGFNRMVDEDTREGSGRSAAQGTGDGRRPGGSALKGKIVGGVVVRSFPVERGGSLRAVPGGWDVRKKIDMRGGGGGVRDRRDVLDLMHGRSRIAMDPRIPTMPGRGVSGFHR